tara:strand:- start:621 stop:857 length:237 start_codon:yes stop_codon:yes gene_type:complete
MSKQLDLQNEIYSLKTENTMLKDKIIKLENIIKSYKSLNLYFDNTDFNDNSPIYKSIPYLKRMDAFNHSNKDINISNI